MPLSGELSERNVKISADEVVPVGAAVHAEDLSVPVFGARVAGPAWHGHRPGASGSARFQRALARRRRKLPR